MLPRERVMAALNHQEPDLVPWGEHSIDYNIYEMTLGRPSFVQGKMKETRALWEGRRDEVVASYKRDLVDLADALGMDIISVGQNPHAGYAPAPLEQIDEETYVDGGGNTYHVSISTEQLMPYERKIEGYEPPTVEQIQAQIEHLEANPPQKPEDSCWEVLRHVVKERKGTHWINSCVGGLGFPVTGPTDEIAYLNLALHPELHGPIAELTVKSCMATLPWYAEEGVDSVMPCADLGTSTALFANPRILQENCMPWWKVYIERAHELGLKVILHSCGCTWEALPSICEAGYDGYEALQGSATMDLKRVKELYGDKLTLWSGIWNEHLILGTPADIEADARHALRWAAPGGGYIYGATHSLAMGTKPENLEMMKACRERWGSYPIRVDG